MKYLKTFGFLAQLGAAFVALLFIFRTISGIFALMIPVEDAAIAWLYENGIVIGLTVGIGILLWWFGDVCDSQKPKEKHDLWDDKDDMVPVVEGEVYE